jgi:hydroxymethylbilane synthase
LRGDELQLRGVIGSPDGREMYRGSEAGPASEAGVIGARLADRLLAAGAKALLDALR